MQRLASAKQRDKLVSSLCFVEILLAFSFDCVPAAEPLSSRAPPLELAQPNYTVYRTKSEAFRAVEAVVGRNPTSFRSEQLKASSSDYTSFFQVVTVEPNGLTDQYEDKLRLLLDFGEHGRELITVEVAIRLLQLLADPSELTRLTKARGGNIEKLNGVLERCVFKIVPMENVHGRELVENGSLCERKNGHGVDSNRNWPVHWGFREKDYDPTEEYPGTQPFSEPEVQMLNALAEEFRPHVWMNMHSGMEALFMPYDHIAAIPDDEAGQMSLELLALLNTMKCKNKCAIGSGGKSVGYLAHGTATDYMHDVLGVPFAFTWEIYGDATANFQDCFRMFNPMLSDEAHQVAENWADAVLAFLEILPSSATALERRKASSLTSRRALPHAHPKVRELQHNRTESDVALHIRHARLTDVYRIASEVEAATDSEPLDAYWDYLPNHGLTGLLIVLLFIALVAILLQKSFCRDLITRQRVRMPRKRHEAHL